MNEKSKYSHNCRSRVLPVLSLKLLTKQNSLKNKKPTQNTKYLSFSFLFLFLFLVGTFIKVSKGQDLRDEDKS